MPRPPPVTSAWEERANPVIHNLPNERSSHPWHILDFKLLQGINPPDADACLTDGRRRVASSQSQRGIDHMAALEKGITKNGTRYSGKTWNILGQVYFPKAATDPNLAFETASAPGQVGPVAIHSPQTAFI